MVQKLFITKEELNDLYWKEGLSFQGIARKLKCSGSAIQRCMYKYNIPRRTNSESQLGNKNHQYGKSSWNKGKKGVMPTPWNKGKKADRLKYPKMGHFFKHTDKSKEKISEIKRRLYKEGKIEVWNKNLTKKEDKRLDFHRPTTFKKGIIPWIKGKKHSEESRKKMRIAHNENNYWYGKRLSEKHKKKLSEIRRKLIREGKLNPLKNMDIRPTSPEKQFMSLIEKYSLPYKYVGDGKFWIEGINPDFINCDGEKIAVEIFGDYWHDSKKIKGLRWSRTEEGRKKILAKYGWKCIIIWEKELKNLSDKEILNKIQNTLSSSESKEL